MRRVTLILLLLGSGCYATTDHDRLRQVESELHMARSDYFFYHLGSAPIGSSAQVEAAGKKLDEHIGRALSLTRKLLGEEDD